MKLHVGVAVDLTAEEASAVKWYCNEDAGKVVRRVAEKDGRNGAEEFVSACVEMHATPERRSQPRADSLVEAFGEMPRRDPGAW